MSDYLQDGTVKPQAIVRRTSARVGNALKYLYSVPVSSVNNVYQTTALIVNVWPRTAVVNVLMMKVVFQTHASMGFVP